MRILPAENTGHEGMWFYTGPTNGGKLTILSAKIDSVSSIEKMHSHTDDYEYYIVLSGFIDVDVEGEIVRVSAKETLEVLPSEVHQVINAGKNSEYVCVKTTINPEGKIIYQ